MQGKKISAVHGSFTIVRELPHAPERVFAAWSDPKAKAAWFSGPSGQWTPGTRMRVTEQARSSTATTTPAAASTARAR